MLRREFVMRTAATGLAAVGLPVVLPRSMASLAHASVDSVTSVPLEGPVELFEMRIGFDLVRLFSNGKPTELLQLIPRLRRKLAGQDVGMPLVRIRDFPDLDGDKYQILIQGRVVGIGQSESSRAGTTGESSRQPPRDALDILAHLEQVVRRHVDDLAETSGPSGEPQCIIVN